MLALLLSAVMFHHLQIHFWVEMDLASDLNVLQIRKVSDCKIGEIFSDDKATNFLEWFH